LIFAVWFSITTVQEMIPGSKRQTTPRSPIIAAMVGLALLVCILFQDFDTNRFVALGVPCLQLGCICALLSGALFWSICRTGFVVSPVTAYASVGFFSGLAGVSVLALHCRLKTRRTLSFGIWEQCFSAVWEELRLELCTGERGCLAVG
jgi:hypothetical protein